MNYADLVKRAIENNETEIEIDGMFDKVTRFPYELFEISSLETLYLDYCLSKLDIQNDDFKNISKLKNLRNLSLIDNGLSFIPRQIFELENLEKLTIFGNKIEKIPYGITQCKNLREININSNLISKLPDYLLNLENLEVLRIGGNPIRELPRRIDLLTNLKTLDIGRTKISNLPIELLKLNLEEFEPDDSLIQITINDKGWMPMTGELYIRKRLEYYFEEYKCQLKKELKLWLANNQIDKVLEVLKSQIPELSYYNSSKDVVLASSRYKYIELERRRGTINFETGKLELNKLIVSLFEIIEEI